MLPTRTWKAYRFRRRNLKDHDRRPEHIRTTVSMFARPGYCGVEFTQIINLAPIRTVGLRSSALHVINYRPVICGTSLALPLLFVLADTN